ncbi:MAG TPA: hypothetical protein DEA46_04135 [Candidatus Moranbacteria bacterium]|nr:hypothetical protein [Candidatus Moranbacteria bacterium]
MKKIKAYWQKNPKKRKLMMFGVVVVGMALSFGLYALAQSFIDSFLDTTRIANTWNVNVDTGAGEIKLADKTCDDGVWFCSLSTTCTNSLGDGTNIIVKRVNETGSKQWKPANTACDKPNCATDGGQDGDNLVADNTVNFSGYPAQDACKMAGGRLPTISELQCIYANRTIFGNNFGTSYYWSATEGSTTYARLVNFNDGNSNYNLKTNSYSVRCVRGW